MKTYAAELSANVVVNIIVGDYVWANENCDGEWVDCTDNGDVTIGIGYTYDAALDEFVAPVFPEPEVL